MKDERSGADRDWVDRVVGLARGLGLNPVRVRWKLEAWRRRVQGWGRRAGSQLDHVTYRNQTCPACGAVQAVSEQMCTRCGAPLDSRIVQLGERITGVVALRPTWIVIGLCLLAYAWVLVQGTGSNLIDLQVPDLNRWGANSPYFTLIGGWWRLATYMLLHGGILHLGFNMWALYSIGPLVEEAYGNRRYLFAFWFTGVAAGAVSLGWRAGFLATVQWAFEALIGQEGQALGAFVSYGAGVGASGSIMGLCGLLGGWSLRVGGSQARQLRGALIRWTLLVLVVGFLIDADNAAHIGGLLAGLLLGLLLAPRPTASSTAQRRRWQVVGGVGLTLMLATALAIPLTPWLDERLGHPDVQRRHRLLDIFRDDEEVRRQRQEAICPQIIRGESRQVVEHYFQDTGEPSPDEREQIENRALLSMFCSSWQPLPPEPPPPDAAAPGPASAPDPLGSEPAPAAPAPPAPEPAPVATEPAPAASAPPATDPAPPVSK